MLFLIRFSGEISTKAKQTRIRFVRRLTHNLEDALRSSGVAFEIRRAWSRLFVETDAPQAFEVLPRVFGVQSLSVVERRPAERLDDVVQAGEELFRDQVQGRRFAVRARVAGDRKRAPFGATAIERELGAALVPYAERVDLTNPEVTAYVEVRDGEAFFFTEQIPGPGGLPLGTEGRAVSLVSGGFDSAVASWRMLKRGVALEYVFCNLGGSAHQRDVLRVTKILSDQWSYGTHPKLHAVDFSELVRELQAKTHSRYWQVLLKRLMLRVAETIARETRSRGIVTGEAIGQVSSQTLQNLYVISQAVDAPIWQPLLGFDKEEIIAQARRIGTYDLSASVAEYCAIVPRHPATKASLKAVLAEEEQLDLSILERAVAERQVFDLRSIRPEELSPVEIEIDEIPAGAVVIDLRSPQAYRAWHYPGALYMDFFQALENYRKLDREKTYVLYCELGLKSGHLAERMRQAGFQAFNFRGGLRRLMEYALERGLLPPELVPPDRLFESPADAKP
jgi:thiamine biosynthesis protein ThiI